MIFHDKINEFLATLVLLKDKLSHNCFALFSHLYAYLEDTDDIEMEFLVEAITDHIQLLTGQFEYYFP